MRDAGKTIIIITHKLQEVLDVSDRVYVIKRGKVVGSVLTKDTSQAELAGMMVGRDVLLDIKKDHICFEEDDDVVYKVCGLTTKNKDGQLVVNDVSFNIRKGEILGIAGVDGNGQTELVGLLTGMICSISGNTYLYDQRITNKWPKELRRLALELFQKIDMFMVLIEIWPLAKILSLDAYQIKKLIAEEFSIVRELLKDAKSNWKIWY